MNSIVYLLDILEHVKNPFSALKEAKRVVKKAGFIFVEFSSYWAYPSGHHLYSFQIFPFNLTEKIVIGMKRLETKDSKEFLFYQFKNLNKISIQKFKKIIKKLNLKNIRDNYLIVLPHKEIKINFIKIFPSLREICTMSYSCILRK
jgi:ubiquinone/menaquinone biosynthesis C-methylase UbiE